MRGQLGAKRGRESWLEKALKFFYNSIVEAVVVKEKERERKRERAGWCQLKGSWKKFF